jgi:hypothetical protein
MTTRRPSGAPGALAVGLLQERIAPNDVGRVEPTDLVPRVEGLFPGLRSHQHCGCAAHLGQGITESNAFDLAITGAATRPSFTFMQLGFLLFRADSRSLRTSLLLFRITSQASQRFRQLVIPGRQQLTTHQHRRVVAAPVRQNQVANGSCSGMRFPEATYRRILNRHGSIYRPFRKQIKLISVIRSDSGFGKPFI